jgi:hypothetical protein
MEAEQLVCPHCHESVRDASAKPFWLALKANVGIIPAMAQDDFAQAAPLIEQAAKKYP